MIKSVVERMTHYYYGKSHIKQISFDEFKSISDDDNILNLYEVYDDGYIGCWYYIIKRLGSSVAIDYGLNNSTLKKLMEPYMEKHNSRRVNVEELKLYRRGIYPIIHKVDSDYFYSNCDIANKKNNSEFDYLYAEVEDGFIGIGQYNNIFSSYKVDTENEIIKQILNINVLSKNVSEDMLMKYVIDDRKEKDFEMII